MSEWAMAHPWMALFIVLAMVESVEVGLKAITGRACKNCCALRFERDEQARLIEAQRKLLEHNRGLLDAAIRHANGGA